MRTRKNSKSNNKIGIEITNTGKIVALIAIIGVITGIFYILNSIKSEMSKEEQAAYLRLHIAAISGGELSSNDLNVLKSMVKSKKSNSDWFKSDYNFYAKNADTDKYDVTYLCDDSYCAKFTVQGISLVDYEFFAKKETGNRIYIVNEYSNNKK